MAPGRGIVIDISADPSTAKAALQIVREQMEQTAQSAKGGGASFGRFGDDVEGSVPNMAAASAALRALRGDMTQNMRAGERFLSMLPGMESLLQTAFPVIGAVALGSALVEMGKKAFDAYENIVELRGALQSLDQLDLTVAKKVQTAADETERAIEQQIGATQGKAAELKQRLAYESNKPVDLSDLFQDKDFAGLKDNIKAGYEDLYKSVAPADAPRKLQQIRTEISGLKDALASTDNAFAVIKNVRGYGPSALEDPKKYYEARLKAADDVEKLLYAEIQKRNATAGATSAEMAKALAQENKHAHEPRQARAASQNGLAEAAAALAQEQARAAADAQKDEDTKQLAELETQHKLLLVSDQEFYKEKLDFQLASIDAEEKALRDRQGVLRNRLKDEHGDKTAKRDKDGNSEAELRTKRELLQLDEQIDAAEAKRGQANSAYTAEASAGNQAAQLANLKAAAELEKQKGDAIAAQIALLREELDLEVQRLQAQGGSPQAIADTKSLEQRNELNLQAEQVYKQIQGTLEANRETVKELNDEAEKNPLLKGGITKTINQDNRDTAAGVRTLAAQYDALAGQLGGSTLDNARKLNIELAELNTPNQRGQAEWIKQLDTSLTSMANRMVENAALGTESFHKMAKSIEKDMLQLALKMAEQKLIPGMAPGGGGGGGFGALFGHPHAAGGQAAGAMLAPLASLAGPKLWQPPQGSGGAAGAPASVLTQLAKGMGGGAGGGGGAPNITLQLINESQAPLSASMGGQSWEPELGQFITKWILSDASQAGPIASAFSQKSG